jgi:hypothetical protein
MIRRDLNFIRLRRHDIGNFGFSAVSDRYLDAAEYTLVQLSIDVSASATGWQSWMEEAVRRIVAAGASSSLKDNLMVRLVAFGNAPYEVHGFKPVAECDPADYQDILFAGGATAVYDAAIDAAEAVGHFGHYLTEQGIRANAVVAVVTDGMDGQSMFRSKDVGKAMAKASRDENLVSLTSLLAGACDKGIDEVSRCLGRFRRDSGFYQYMELRRMDEETLREFVASVVAAISSAGETLRAVPRSSAQAKCDMPKKRLSETEFVLHKSYDPAHPPLRDLVHVNVKADDGTRFDAILTCVPGIGEEINCKNRTYKVMRVLHELVDDDGKARAGCHAFVNAELLPEDALPVARARWTKRR